MHYSLPDRRLLLGMIGFIKVCADSALISALQNKREKSVFTGKSKYSIICRCHIFHFVKWPRTTYHTKSWIMHMHRIHHIRSSTPYMVEVSQPHVPTCGPCRVGYKKMIKTKARQGNESHNCVSLIFKGLDSLWCRCCKWDPPPDVLFYCILCH